MEFSNSELNVIRHALVRLGHHNASLLRPHMSEYYKGHYSPEQFDRAELEMDIIDTLLNKIPIREELEET